MNRLDNSIKIADSYSVEERDKFLTQLPKLPVTEDNLQKVVNAYELHQKYFSMGPTETRPYFKYFEGVLDGTDRRILSLWCSVNGTSRFSFLQHIVKIGRANLIDKVKGYEKISSQFATLLSELDGMDLQLVYETLFFVKKGDLLDFFIEIDYELVEEPKDELIDQLFQGLKQSTIERVIKSVFESKEQGLIYRCNSCFRDYHNKQTDQWAKSAIIDCVSSCKIETLALEFSDNVIDQWGKTFTSQRIINSVEVFASLSEERIGELIKELFSNDYRGSAATRHKDDLRLDEPRRYKWPILRMMLEQCGISDSHDKQYNRYVKALVKFFTRSQDDLVSFVIEQSKAYNVNNDNKKKYQGIDSSRDYRSYNFGLGNLMKGLTDDQFKECIEEVKKKEEPSCDFLESLQLVFMLYGVTSEKRQILKDLGLSN